MPERVFICGRRWNLVREKIHHTKNCWGYCDDPATPNKSIVLDERLTGTHLVEIALHEGAHAAFWQMSEETITEYAKDMARLLTKLGVLKE